MLDEPMTRSTGLDGKSTNVPSAKTLSDLTGKRIFG